MAPAGLSLFPATSTNLPRKSSLRRAHNNEGPDVGSNLSLTGVTFQVVSSSKPSAKIQPAADTIKHSLFCEPIKPVPESGPMSTFSTVSQSPLGQQARTQQNRGTGQTQDKTQTEDKKPPTDLLSSEDDELRPLPQNFHFGSSLPPKKSISSHLDRSTLPSISTQLPRADILKTPVSEKADSLSPLPDKAHFKPSPPLPRDGFSPSSHSSSPATSKSSSDTGSTPSMRSIFPVYDPLKATDRQSYYPTPGTIHAPAYMSDKVSKVTSPAEKQYLKQSESDVGLIDGYEHIPAAAYADSIAIWKGSNGDSAVSGRKVRFGLYQPPGDGKRLAIGTSREDYIYTLDREMFATSGAAVPKQYAIKKHCPTAPSSLAVAQIVVPPRSNSKKSGEDTTTIFPQAAAIHAVEETTDPRKAARNMASFDSSSDSPEAVRVAIAKAHSRYSCNLIKRTRKRDSLGNVTAQYDLVHPSLGSCAVTVSKTQSASSTTGPRAKICLHHPSATPAALLADTLNLAFLDFAHDSCVLDVPGLLALDSKHIIDTVICALLIVAVIENDALIAETTTFEPPPRTPLTGSSKASRRKSSRDSTLGSKKFFRKSEKRRNRKDVMEIIPLEETAPAVVVNDEELGGLAKGTIVIVGLAFKASAWVIVSGVKVGLWGVGKGIEMARKKG